MDMPIFTRLIHSQISQIRLARLTAIVLVGIALGLALLPSYHARDLRIPDPWAYQFAIDNFAHGLLTVSDEQIASGQMKARLQGGDITQYVLVRQGHWAFEKSPGYPLLAAPFAAIGASRLTNGLLMLLASLVLYVVLATYVEYSEWIACAGVGLLLLSPLTLMALRQTDMDTFASGALLVIGAGGALWAYGRLSIYETVVPSFAAGLALGWAVVVREPNALIVASFSAWWIIQALRRSHVREGIALALGIAAALAILCAYNLTVFGNWLDSGYAHSLYTPDFAWSTSGRDIAGAPVGTNDVLTILIGQAAAWVQPLLIGLPLLPLAVVGAIMGYPRRVVTPSPGAVVLQRRANGVILTERPATRLLPNRLMALVWVLTGYAPYAGLFFYGVGRELTNAYNRFWGYYAVDRYLYPLVFALTLLCAAALARVPRLLAVVITLVLCAAGIVIYWRALSAM